MSTSLIVNNEILRKRILSLTEIGDSECTLESLIQTKKLRKKLSISDY